MNLSVEHVLMFALVVCVFYYMRCNRVEGYSPTGNCIHKSTLSDNHYGGTAECLKRGNYENTKLMDFFHDNNPSFDEMVERINSGRESEGGFNVADPEECVNRIKKCFDK